MRRAAKRDANEKPIIEALKKAGWGVVRLSDPGVPDLLCWRGLSVVLLEVKAADGQLTETQQRYTGPRIVVRTPAEALRALKFKN